MNFWLATAYAADVEDATLPQFNPVYFSAQIFWAIVSFIILLWLLNKYVLPVLSQSLDDRAHQIEHNLSVAHQQRIEAEKIRVEYQKKLDDIKYQAKNIIDRAHQQAIEESHVLQQELEKKMRRKKESFNIELAYAKAQAIKEIHNMSVNIAILATAKLIEHQVSHEEAQHMVNKAIQELKII